MKTRTLLSILFTGFLAATLILTSLFSNPEAFDKAFAAATNNATIMDRIFSPENIIICIVAMIVFISFTILFIFLRRIQRL